MNKIWGIIGKPVQHSFSPVIFNHIFESFDLPIEYVHFEIEDELLGSILGSLGSRNIQMLNVTHPFKNKILGYCDDIDEVAAITNSVNVIYFDGTKIHGHNTDWYGALKALESDGIVPEKAILLGSGGAARSLVYALFKLNPQVRIWVTSRTPDYKNPRWKPLRNLLGSNFHLIDYSDLRIIAQDKDLIINCTPLGLADFPYAMPCRIEELPDSIVLWDLIYNPVQTRWLVEGAKAGLKTLNGIKMLVYQAELGYKIVTGRSDFPVETILQLVEKKLNVQKK